MKYKLITQNVLDAVILSLLKTRLRLLSYKEKIHQNEILYTIKIYYFYPFYFGKTELINLDDYDIHLNFKEQINTLIPLKIKNKVLNRVKCSSLNIDITSREYPNVDNCYYITLSLKFDQEINQIKDFNRYIYGIDYSVSISDLKYRYRIRNDYPIIHDILAGQSGYRWVDYYQALQRIPWLLDYFLAPKSYLNLVNDLLYFFAGLDEICLFDLVCKLHLDSTKISPYKSFIHMRYVLKLNFIERIPKLEKVLFDKNWKLYDEIICSLDSVHYLRLEFYLANTKLTVEHLINAVGNKNYDLFQYILDHMTRKELTHEINRIKDFLVSVTNKFDLPLYHKMLTEIEIKEDLLSRPETDDYIFAIPGLNDDMEDD